LIKAEYQGNLWRKYTASGGVEAALEHARLFKREVSEGSGGAR
jgi:hypothetical protein